MWGGRGQMTWRKSLEGKHIYIYIYREREREREMINKKVVALWGWS